jgi:minor extracellular protease Epr
LPRKLRDRVDWGAHLIGAPKAWKEGLTGEGVRIAILDTGGCWHPDLRAGIAEIEDFTGTGGADRAGHGTAVAGIIGARANNLGVVGIAPNSRLYMVKVLDDEGEGTYIQLIWGLRWARKRKVALINLSLGGQVNSPMLHKEIKACTKEGIIVIAASGNGGDENPEVPTGFPARYPEVISVGSIDPERKLSRFSSKGKVDVVAPGRGIHTTWPPDRYRQLSGTSFATPQVTGLLALAIEDHRRRRKPFGPEEAKTFLREISIDICHPGFDPASGWGIAIWPS